MPTEPTRTPLLELLARAMAVAMITSGIPAQVPEGSAVIATFNTGIGIPGLFLVPLTGGPTVPIGPAD